MQIFDILAGKVPLAVAQQRDEHQQRLARYSLKAIACAVPPEASPESSNLLFFHLDQYCFLLVASIFRISLLHLRHMLVHFERIYQRYVAQDRYLHCYWQKGISTHTNLYD
jgi:hypothetical protein